MPPVVAHLGTDASRTDCSFGPTRGHHASERPGRGLGEAALPHPHYAEPPAISHLGTHPAPARYLGWAMLSGGSKRSEKRGPPAAPSCLQCWARSCSPTAFLWDMNLPKTVFWMAGGGFNSRGPIAARSSRRRSVLVLSQREALATRRQRIHQVDDVAGIAR